MSRRFRTPASHRHPATIRFLGALSMAGLLLAGTGLAVSPAAADPRDEVRTAHTPSHSFGHRGRYGYGHGGGYHHGHDHGHGYRHHRRYWRGHHHHGGRTLLGIGLGLLMYDLYDHRRRRAAAAYRDRVPGYGQAAVPELVVVTDPGRVPPVSPASSAAAPGDACLQEREYQTVITVGGHEREAYGSACLMPDGSWRLGAPRLVPER